MYENAEWMNIYARYESRIIDFIFMLKLEGLRAFVYLLLVFCYEKQSFLNRTHGAPRCQFSNLKKIQD